MNTLNLRLKLYKIIEPWFKKLELSINRQLFKIRQAKSLAIGLEKLEQYRKRHPNRYVEAARNQIDGTKCKHLKGGGRTAYRDWSVVSHRFPDGSVRIWCMICMKKWTPESPDWKEAVKMAEESTNTQSASGVGFDTKINAVYFDVLK